jgi:hypothetical protein
MTQQLLHRPNIVALCSKWVANECCSVWQLARLPIPLARTASATARWMTDS